VFSFTCGKDIRNDTIEQAEEYICIYFFHRLSVSLSAETVSANISIYFPLKLPTTALMDDARLFVFGFPEVEPELKA